MDYSYTHLYHDIKYLLIFNIIQFCHKDIFILQKKKKY